MKHASVLLICSFLSLAVAAQKGYNIQVTLKPYKNEKIYLGYYYGKMKALADSMVVNANSAGVFSGKEPLHGGIYFIVSPRKEILFELLIDKDQEFSITADTSSIPSSVTFTGTVDNTQFLQPVVRATGVRVTILTIFFHL